MKHQEEDKIKEIFIRIFPTMRLEEFSFDKPRTTFENWDSLTHMQLLSEIEGAFGVTFEMDEIVDVNRPADLVTLLEKKKP